MTHQLQQQVLQLQDYAITLENKLHDKSLQQLKSKLHSDQLMAQVRDSHKNV